jgi:GH18 family chitinase
MMTYDLHGNWESETGHNAPMYPRTGETGDQRNLNIEWVVNYWINNGCPREKLTLGLGAYGRTFRLTNANNNGLGMNFQSFKFIIYIIIHFKEHLHQEIQQLELYINKNHIHFNC